MEAVGVSVATEQIEWANRWIREEGLQNRCRVEFCDYRKVPENKLFDKAVSVGFIEHVGDKNIPTFYNKVWRVLRPGGRYLNHGISLTPHVPHPNWNAFVLAYVFPNGELVSINRTLDHLAKTGFEIRDVEDLREHYMYTLTRWLERLEYRADQLKEKLIDEVMYRIYRIYIAGAANGFKWNIYHLYQTLVVKSGKDVSGFPLTRDAWYQ